MNIVFWNNRTKSDFESIVDLIDYKNADIIGLAECTISTSKIIRELKKKYPKRDYHSITDIHDRLKVISSLPANRFKNFKGKYDSLFWNVNNVTHHFNIVFVHLPSKLRWDSVSVNMEAINMSNHIREFERATKNKNTLLIGDFNLNPYEFGMRSSVGLHGVKDKFLAPKDKNIYGQDYDRFYNPMWNFLGDQDDVPGTYYFSRSDHDNPHWHTLDQVLIRSGVLSKYKKINVEIITDIKGETLIQSKSKRIKTKFSDHLPILITIN